MLNWWGCTIYTAREVEEELQSLRDDHVELLDELSQRWGLELTLEMMDDPAVRLSQRYGLELTVEKTDDRVVKRLLIAIDRLLSPAIAHDHLWEQLRSNVQEQLEAEEEPLLVHHEAEEEEIRKQRRNISCDSCLMQKRKIGRHVKYPFRPSDSTIKGKRFSKQLDTRDIYDERWNTYDVCQSCFDQLSEAEQAELTISKGFKGLNSVTDVLPQPTPVPTHGGNWKVDPADWGMTNAQLLLFVEACMATREWDELSQTTEWDKEYGHVNGYQLCDSYVKKWTAGTGCSVSLLMNTEPRKAEIMISHGKLTSRHIGSLSSGCSMGGKHQ